MYEKNRLKVITNYAQQQSAQLGIRLKLFDVLSRLNKHDPDLPSATLTGTGKCNPNTQVVLREFHVLQTTNYYYKTCV